MRKNELERLFVTEDVSLRTALQRLCESGRQILFVVEKGELKATLTDGDIRRFLLRGGSLESPLSGVANYAPQVIFSTERRNAEEILRESKFNAFPIVDEEMRIVDAVFRHDDVSLNGVEIRALTAADLPMVLAFFDQMAGDTRAMFNRGDVNKIRVVAHLNRSAEDHEIHFAAVQKQADGSDLMVGYVFLWDLHVKIPWLGIAVREDWKGHHLGRRLLSFIDAWAQPKGYGGLMLTSVPANVRAHALYERMGFVYSGAYPDGEFLYMKRYSF